MSLEHSQCKELIISQARELGIERVGFVEVMPVDDGARTMYDNWISDGRHGSMYYLERYKEVRDNPANLLPGAKTIICCAVNYLPAERQPVDVPRIASYALGRDYHEVVRNRLARLAAFISENFGGEHRVCVDTAPLRERYWAQKSGVGYVALNSQLVVPGCGSHFFLGEILSTLRFKADEPCALRCMGCGACARACPGGAIGFDGSFDARRCLSYLTIEYRGELDDDTRLGNRVYGCDTCQEVCPLNKNARPTVIEEFAPTERLLRLDRKAMEQMTPDDFSEIFRRSAVKRAKYAGFMRNVRHLPPDDCDAKSGNQGR